MTRRILTLPTGRRTLRAVCQPARWADEWHPVVQDLRDTLNATTGAAGLAAPQIGSLLRIFVVRDGPRILEFVNPVVEGIGGMVTDWEGCLSMPGFSAVITRSESVRVRMGMTLSRLSTCIEYSGHLARVIQHEYDHLDGILISMREAEQARERKAQK